MGLLHDLATATKTAWISVIYATIIAGCTPDSEDYFPLNSGRVWHYDISRTTMDGTFRQKQILESLPAIDWQGAVSVPFISAGGAQYLYRNADKGLQRIARKARDAAEFSSSAESYTVLPAEISTGTRWRQTEYTQVLENTGSPWETLFKIVQPIPMEYVIESEQTAIHVAAGEFHDCIKVKGTGQANVDVGNYIGRTLISIEVENWYAKGVGLVKSLRREKTTADALDYGEIQFELEYLVR